MSFILVQNSAVAKTDLLTLAQTQEEMELERLTFDLELYNNHMKSHVVAYGEEIRTLQQMVISSKNRERELEILYQAELDALDAEIKSNQTAIQEMEKEMLASAKKASERMTQEREAQEKAMRATDQANQARITAVRQEVQSSLETQYKEQTQVLTESFHSVIGQMAAELKATADKINSTNQVISQQWTAYFTQDVQEAINWHNKYLENLNNVRLEIHALPYLENLNNVRLEIHALPQ